MMMMMMTKIVEYSQPDSSDSSCCVLQPCFFCTRPAARDNLLWRRGIGARPALTVLARREALLELL